MRISVFSDFLHFYIKDRKILQITVLNETENKFENKIFQLRGCVAEKLVSLKLINFSIESKSKSNFFLLYMVVSKTGLNGIKHNILQCIFNHVLKKLIIVK